MVELTCEEVRSLDNLDNCDDEALLAGLIAEQFILDDPEVEAEYLRYQHNRYANNNHLFELTISPSQQCNFDCVYCYVLKRESVMTEATQDNIMRFIAYNYEQAPFKKLRINWYGGEPLLCIEVIERLSAQIINFCEENGIIHLGHILSNGSLADEDMSKRIAKKCGITSVMITLSGKHDDHDYQRCEKSGAKCYERIIENVDHMLDEGIIVHTNYVANKNNQASSLESVSDLCKKKGVVTRYTSTGRFDKEHIYLKDEKNTELEPFSDQESAEFYREFLKRQNLSSKEYAEVLQPKRLFCAAWVTRSFFIDDLGNVSACMIDMDYPEERMLFNINDWDPDNHLSFKHDRLVMFANLNPLDNEDCRKCKIYPICRGGCALKWFDKKLGKCANSGYLNLCIDDIVLDYYYALKAESVIGI